MSFLRILIFKNFSINEIASHTFAMIKNQRLKILSIFLKKIIKNSNLILK